MVALSAMLLMALPTRARAQSRVDSLVPPDAPNCRIAAPPEEAGIAATPGGFLIVFPRNDVIAAKYTGCKMLWLADTDRSPRLATLYFEGGQLARAIAHDTRSSSGAPEGACGFPEGRSLLPNLGRRFGDSACKGFMGEALYALRIPTWPRRCLTKPDEPVCTAEPR
jgi:hypothetical protein